MSKSLPPIGLQHASLLCSSLSSSGCMLSHFSCVWLFATSWTIAQQAPLSKGFSRKKYWSELPGPLPGDLPDPGIKPTSLLSPALASRFFTTSTTWDAPSLSPRVCSNLCPLNQWCYLTISSSATGFSFAYKSFPSVRVFSNESALRIRWTKYWSFNFSISSSNEYSELTSFRIHWLDLPAVQGTLKNHHQHHNLKASIPQLSAFFMVQLSYLYMITRKTIAYSGYIIKKRLAKGQKQM